MKQKNYCSRLYKKVRKKYYENFDLKNITDNKFFWNTIKIVFNYFLFFYFIFVKIKVTKTHHKKTHGHKQTDKQTTQDNIYQPIHPQGTNDIARGMGLIKR